MTQEDIKEVLPDEADAKAAFEMLDDDKDGQISLQAGQGRGWWEARGQTGAPGKQGAWREQRKATQWQQRRAEGCFGHLRVCGVTCAVCPLCFTAGLVRLPPPRTISLLHLPAAQHALCAPYTLPQDCSTSLLNIFQERKNLAATLKDTKSGGWVGGWVGFAGAGGRGRASPCCWPALPAGNVPASERSPPAT